MLRIILILLALGAFKVLLNVGGALVDFFAGLIKIVLFFLFIFCVGSAFDGNWIPLLLLIGIPVGGIAYLIRCARRAVIKKKRRRSIPKGNDYVEVIDMD